MAKTNKFLVSDTIRDYYVSINKAELAIVDSNFKEALLHYGVAFRLKAPNAKDLHNAYCAAAFVPDCEQGRIYLEKLANLGYRIPDSLIGNTYFFQCTGDGLKAVADKARNDFQLSAIGLQLDSLAKEDQSVRSDENTDFAKMQEKDAAVLQSLYRLLKKEKFTNVETGMSYGNAGNDYSTLWLIRWHGRGKPSILDSILLESVLKGNYDPSVYASLISTDNNAQYGIYYNPARTWTDQQRRLINENRAKIYLEPLDDYEKKAKMQMKTDQLRRRLMDRYGIKAIKSNVFFKLTPDVYLAPAQ